MFEHGMGPAGSRTYPWKSNQIGPGKGFHLSERVFWAGHHTKRIAKEHPLAQPIQHIKDFGEANDEIEVPPEQPCQKVELGVLYDFQPFVMFFPPFAKGERDNFARQAWKASNSDRFRSAIERVKQITFRLLHALPDQAGVAIENVTILGRYDPFRAALKQFQTDFSFEPIHRR